MRVVRRRGPARAAALALAALLPACAPGTPRPDGEPVRLAPFVDHHVHVFNVGWWVRQREAPRPGAVELGDASSEDEAIARVAQAARALAAGAWVTGFGWSQEAWPGRAMPGDALSRRVPDHPVALARADGHALWVNAAAYRAAGASPGAPVLLERDAERITTRVPPPSDAEVRAAWRAGADALAANGVRRAYDAGVLAPPGVAVLDTDLARYAALLAAEDSARALPLQLSLMIPAPSPYAERVLRMTPAERALSPRVRVTHLKLFADGALGSRGAALARPYADAPATAGVARMDAPRILALARRAIDAGLDVATHAIGDAAVHATLDAYEALLRERPGLVPARLRIEHFSVASEDDLARAARLGVALSIQSNFNAPRGALADFFATRRLGAGAMARTYAWERLRQLGALLVEGSDHFGAPGAALDGVHAALTGEGALGAAGDTPAVRARVLAMHQRWLAPGGTLEPLPAAAALRDGTAPAIVLSDDPRRAPLATLRSITVLPDGGSRR